MGAVLTDPTIPKTKQFRRLPDGERTADEAVEVVEKACPFNWENVCRNLNRAATIFGPYEAGWRSTTWGRSRARVGLLRQAALFEKHGRHVLHLAMAKDDLVVESAHGVAR